MRFRLSKKKLLLWSTVALLCLVLFVAQTKPAQAVCFSIGDCVSGGIASLLYAFFFLVNKLLAFLVYVFELLISFRLTTNATVITSSWTIVRNFANMFFIVIMIIMAFATIFDVGFLGGYDVSSLIGKFLIAALLINFSLVISGLLIDGAESLNKVFLASIGDFSDRFGSALDPTKTVPGLNTVELRPADVTAAMIPQLFFSTIIVLIVDFSLLVAVAFAFIRIPVIWVLLIFSPLAWLAGVLPATKNLNKQWWDNFIKWNTFLPVYLFVLYFGLYFLSNQGAVIQSLITSALPQGAIAGGASFGIQTLFFYFFVAFVLIGGTGMALSGGIIAGTGAVSGAQLANNWAKRITGVRAAQNAAQAKIKEVKEEGLYAWGKKVPLIGGPPLGTDTMNRAFGVSGADYKPSKDFVAKVEVEAKRIKDDETTGKVVINEEFARATATTDRMSPEGVARRSILYERGMADTKDFAADMGVWAQKNPFLAEAMTKKAVAGKLRNIDPKEQLKMAAGEGDYKNLESLRGVRKELFGAIKDNDKALESMSVSQVKEATDLFGGDQTNDSVEFRKAIAKQRPDIVAKYESENSTEVNKEGEKKKGKPITDNLYDIIKKKSAKDIAEMLIPAWENKDFQLALGKHLSALQDKFPGGMEGGKLRLGQGESFKNDLRKFIGGNSVKIAALERNVAFRPPVRQPRQQRRPGPRPNP